MVGKTFILLFFLLFSVISCSGLKKEEYRTNDASLAAIMLNKELRVGVNISMPPLCFYASTGKIVGYEIDIAEKIAAALDVRLKVISVSINNRNEKLSYHSIDYIAGGFIADSQHQENFSLTTPYVRDAIILIKSRRFFKESASEQKARIGCTADDQIINTLVESKFYQQSDYTLEMYETLDKLLVALDYGNLDFAAINLLTYYNKVAVEKKNYEPFGEPLVVNLYSYAFRKEDEQLRNAVNDILYDLAYDGTLSALSRKWFGADVSLIGKY